VRGPLWLLSLVVLLAACGADQGLPAEPLSLGNRLPVAYLGEPYRAEILAQGGVRPYRYELSGKLPKGLSFSSGRITGVPQEKGTFELKVTVKDAALSLVTKTMTLEVRDPPPPSFRLELPPGATADPFIMLARLEGRETRGFRARFVMKKMSPDMDSLEVTPKALYVARYDEKGQALDLDAAFLKPFSGGEVFRVVVVPGEKLVPKVPWRARFWDRKGRLFPASERVSIKRDGEGKYGFSDLLKLAENWGKRVKKEGSPPLPGDLNGDGRVDEADLALLRGSYDWRVGKPKAEKAPPPAEKVAPRPGTGN